MLIVTWGSPTVVGLKGEWRHTINYSTFNQGRPLAEQSSISLFTQYVYDFCFSDIHQRLERLITALHLASINLPNHVQGSARVSLQTELTLRLACLKVVWGKLGVL